MINPRKLSIDQIQRLIEIAVDLHRLAAHHCNSHDDTSFRHTKAIHDEATRDLQAMGIELDFREVVED